MSKKLAVSLAVSFVVLTACQREVTSPGEISPTPNFSAQAGGVETNVSVPIDQSIVVPCANGGVGETVVLSGDLHIVLNVTIDDQGGVHVKEKFQPQGVSGLGLTTGTTYRATGGTQTEFNIGFGVEETDINNVRLIGPGPGNNLLIHSTDHITINANGVVTVVHSNSTVDCR